MDISIHTSSRLEARKVSREGTHWVTLKAYSKLFDELQGSLTIFCETEEACDAFVKAVELRNPPQVEPGSMTEEELLKGLDDIVQPPSLGVVPRPHFSDEAAEHRDSDEIPF
jgi:hypothetical protein